jgi:hypothetical protein
MSEKWRKAVVEVDVSRSTFVRRIRVLLLDLKRRPPPLFKIAERPAKMPLLAEERKTSARSENFAFDPSRRYFGCLLFRRFW